MTRSNALPLTLTSIKKSYNSLVLEDVSITLQPGDIVGLLGSNGAGKTTLLKIALGICTPDAGQAQLFGESSMDMSDAAKEQLAYVPQDPELFGWLTGIEMLTLMRGLYPRWNHEEALAMARNWKVPLDKQISTLSPGQCQRLQIVRAFATQAKLLILDEPVGSLDPAGRRQFLSEMMARCAEQNITALFSTHIVSDLERCANKVAILHDGRILLFEELDVLKGRLFRLELPRAAAKLWSGDSMVLRIRDVADGKSNVVLHADHAFIRQKLVLLQQDVLPAQLSLEDLIVELGL